MHAVLLQHAVHAVLQQLSSIAARNITSVQMYISVELGSGLGKRQYVLLKIQEGEGTDPVQTDIVVQELLVCKFHEGIHFSSTLDDQRHR